MARELGQSLAARHIQLIYGGGKVGLMGVIADAALAAGGTVIGVIPQALFTKEVAHGNLTELIVVHSMHERKFQMAERADAFIALPGGYGTFEEFCEVVTWTQLGVHAKPCGVLNVGGYYDPLLTQLDRAVAHRFLTPEHRRLVIASASIEDLLGRLAAFTPNARDKWLKRDQG
jgi:uncharacterized protein (TIGR00730 family)